MTWIAAAEGVDPQAFDTEEAAEAARALLGPRANCVAAARTGTRNRGGTGMSDQATEASDLSVNRAMQAAPCEHFYAWLSPAGARLSARICQGCGWPDPDWLNHLVEVDRGHGASCVHCSFAEHEEQG